MADSAAVRFQRAPLVDLSTSVKASQTQAWAQAARSLVFDQTNYGDDVLVLPVGANDQVAPVFDVHIPAPDPDAGMDGEAAAKRALNVVASDGPAALEVALQAPVKASDTRFVASLRRIPIAAGKQNRVRILSDGIESTPALRVEGASVTTDNVSAMVGRLVEAFRLPRGGLRGVVVSFVLNSLRPPEIAGHFRDDVESA